MQPFRFCPFCSSELNYIIPTGDEKKRPVCPDCHSIHYSNPKVVVGSVAIYESKFLLCKRAIEPRIGFWTLPAGYLELDESTEEGAIREAKEEALTDIKIVSLLAVYSLPHINQVQILYLSELLTPDFSEGIESLEVRLFEWSEIPWPELAFPSVKRALNHAKQMLSNPEIAPDMHTKDLKLLNHKP